MTDDPLAWETLTSETVYTCPGFDVVHDDVRLPNGTDTDFDYLSEPPAVVILPFTPEGDVVVIEEWRQAVDRVNRGLPAGTTESHDDDFASAARRELEEETGYRADRVEALDTVEPANGVANAVHHHFVAQGCRPTGEQDLDEDETIRVTTEPFEDLYADVLAGDVRDGRMALALLAYAARERNA